MDPDPDLDPRLDLGRERTVVCDLTTTGRRSGRKRTIEIWCVVVDGRLVVTGTPGRRDWLANLRAEPRAHVALRDPRVEVDVVAEEVLDPDARRALVRRVWAVEPWYERSAPSLDAWVADAPLVVLRPVPAAATPDASAPLP